VDDNEWKKVLEGVYTGFSVGGSYGAKWPDPVLEGVTRYEAKPVEISLVDVPCMPGAMFEIVKADGASEMRKFVTWETTTTPGDEYTYTEAPASPDAFTSGYVEVTEARKSLGVAELLKEANMNTSDLLSKLAASSDPEMKALAGELEKAFPPKKEKKDEESDDPEGDKKSKKNPFDPGDEPQEEDGHEEPDGDEGPNPEAESDGDSDESAEAEEQPTAGQPSTEQTEAIRAVVIQLLEELGFVQEQGGQPGAPAAVKFVTAEALQKRLSASDELKKQYDALKDRQTSLTEDLAKLITNVDEMVKRMASGVAPGGTLLFVGHRPIDPATGASTPAAPARSCPRW